MMVKFLSAEQRKWLTKYKRMAGDCDQLARKLRQNITKMFWILTFMIPLVLTNISVGDTVPFGDETTLGTGVFFINSTLSSARDDTIDSESTTLAAALTSGSTKHEDFTTGSVTPHTYFSAAYIISSCEAFINALSVAAAAYTECAIKYARPLRFCEHCVVHYLKSKHLYDIIMLVS